MPINGRSPTWATIGACLVVMGLVGACGETEDRARVAVATCGLPVSEAVLGNDDVAEVSPMRTGVEVVDLGEGRFRVTGLVLRPRTHRSDPDARLVVAPFVCEVAPDPSDKLRGFKVTKLEVDRLQPMQ